MSAVAGEVVEVPVDSEPTTTQTDSTGYTLAPGDTQDLSLGGNGNEIVEINSVTTSPSSSSTDQFTIVDREAHTIRYDGEEEITLDSIDVAQLDNADPETDDAIGVLEITVSKAPGASNIDLSEATIQQTDDTGTFDLVYEDVFTAGAQDGAFGVAALKDEDGSLPVINSVDDRLIIELDMGTNTLGSPANVYGEELTEGSSARIQINTQQGASTTERIVVPQSLSGEQAVAL
ncbi:hypothetical protein OB916_03575 [Halobacteria archaeon HArc-curdl5-1]|uniref:Flagellin n=1 Tax=Halapricum hydrolyticum TaxID=2979991 RepID=A0AAE3I9T0_9EURY|nr:hypothetical protein [Halapricum hydrolyticum]MCU4726067.1 hypothetical protein [Halapricum hydrolyticum]